MSLRRPPTRATSLAAVVLILGTAGSIALWWSLRHFEGEVAATRFQRDATERAHFIRGQFAAALEALQSVALLFEATDSVSRRQFDVFTAPILHRHPWILGFGWNPVVPAAEREAHERAGRDAGLAGYRITERESQGRMVPAAERSEYVVVWYMAPREGNRAAVGFDVASEPRRREALSRARDTGELAVTSPIVLVQEDRERLSFLAFLPRYRKGAPTRDRAGRRASIAGFVVGVYRVADLVESALAALTPLDMETRLVDASGPVEFYVHSALSPVERAGFEHTHPIPLGGRSWSLRFTPSHAYLAGLRTWAPGGALLAGLLITGILAAYLAVLRGRAVRVEQLVAQRTVELADSNRDLEAEVARRTRVESELKRHRDSLEEAVQARTADLSTALDEVRREAQRRERAEATLRENEERLQLTLNAVADGAWDWNVASGEVRFSDSWLASLGYERCEIEPHVRSWERLVHPEDMERVRTALQDHFEGRTPIYECINRLRMKSGEYRWNRDRGRVVERGPDGAPLRMVGSDTDITERVLAENETRRLEQMVQQSQKLESVGVLAGGIAHDFNNLLVGILGSADLVLRTMPLESPNRRTLEQVKLAATRAADLTRQLLAYSGRGTASKEHLDLSELVKEMAHLMEAATSKKAVLRYEFGRNLPTVRGDPTQLRQIVMNLMTNASDAIGENEGRITVRTRVVTVGTRELSETLLGDRLVPGDYVCLEVEDTGEGMDDETRARIFDPFFSTKFKGHGLGLAATLGIVRNHEGAIKVTSARGRGTVFRILFPRAGAPGTAPAMDRAEDAPGWRGAGTVLVVDDETSVREVATNILEHLGFRVLTAVDGRHGVETFEAHAEEIALVLLDRTMPTLSGSETLRELQRIRPDVPVLFSSGYSEGDGYAVEPGAVGYVQKPYTVAELEARVRSALAR